MSNDAHTDNASYSEYVNYIQSVVTAYERGNEEKYLDIKKDLHALVEKINDDNLYLGTVGSFSSGKSTFINSVIHKNLLPTDAVQCTTVAASIIKKAECNDLEISYNDGSIAKFSENGDEMLNNYQVQKNTEINSSKNHLPFYRKIIAWIKKLFRIQSNENHQEIDLESCINLFKRVIATEELASDVKYVTLYYRNADIPYKIALVDTPGTESLNKRHNEVTKNAIDNICDAIVVIIPYDEPVSEELLDYVNANLAKHKSECIFVVTKVELLGDRDELPRLLRVIKRRLENGLSIESACVIPMPTLVYLKSVDSEMQTTFLNDIADEDRNELIAMYEAGISKINDLLEQNRNDYIKKKIVSICERMNVKLNSNLTDVVNEYEEKHRLLQNEVLRPLDDFEQFVKAEIAHCCDTNIKRVNGDISFVQKQFSTLEAKMEEVIEKCGDSQQLMERIDFTLESTFAEIQESVNAKLSDYRKNFNVKIETIDKVFAETYSVCSVEPKSRKVPFDSYIFFTDEFLTGCANLLQEKIGAVKATIRNDTSGIFKKVKSFFSNPLSKHKEMALCNLMEAIEAVCQNTKVYTSENINEMISDYGRKAQNNVADMVDKNRSAIESHINATVKALKDNTKGKADTQACIDKLNQYIKKIKEVG